MTRFVFVLAAAGIACSHAPPPVAATPAKAYPFHAVGRATSGRVIEDLIGTAYVHDDEVVVVVTSGFAQLRPSNFTRPVGLSAGLAYCHTGGRWAGSWDFRAKSDMIDVGRIKARGDTLADSISFVIKGTKDLDLSEHWLAIQQHRFSSPKGDSTWYEATRPVHSQPYVFDANPARRDSVGHRCNEGD
jgi:hypothetical protein